MRARARVALLAAALGTAAAGSLWTAPLAHAESPRASSATVHQYDTPHAGVVTGTGIAGRSQITDSAGGSVVTMQVSGLVPGHEYGVHVHFGRCADFLGHYRYDVAGPGTRANEVWLDLVANAGGRASDQVRVATVESSGPLSVVVHAESNPDHAANPGGGAQPGPRLACGDYLPNGS